MKEWLFVYKEQKQNAGWWLKITEEKQLLAYVQNSHLFQDDCRQYHRVENSMNSKTAVAHSEYGGAIRCLQSLVDIPLDTDTWYAYLANLQYQAMSQVLAKSGVLYINRNGGFCVGMQRIPTKGTVRRDSLKFPRYLSDEIRIKRFDDGTHYYAYIGDMQVRDGEILKWETYEDAYQAARSFAEDRKRENKHYPENIKKVEK